MTWTVNQYVLTLLLLDVNLHVHLLSMKVSVMCLKYVNHMPTVNKNYSFGVYKYTQMTMSRMSMYHSNWVCQMSMNIYSNWVLLNMSMNAYSIWQLLRYSGRTVTYSVWYSIWVVHTQSRHCHLSMSFYSKWVVIDQQWYTSKLSH